MIFNPRVSDIRWAYVLRLIHGELTKRKFHRRTCIMKKKLKFNTKFSASLMLLGNIANPSYSMEYEPHHIEMSKIVMGTGDLHSLVDANIKIPEEPGEAKKDAVDKAFRAPFKLLDRAAELGINTFDTASIYAQSEEILREWLDRRTEKKQVYVIIKGGFFEEDEKTKIDKKGDKYNSRLTGSPTEIKQKVEEEIEGSLNRLRVTETDKNKKDNVSFIFLTHRDDVSVKNGKIEDREKNTIENIAKGLADIELFKNNPPIFGLSNLSKERAQEFLDVTTAKTELNKLVPIIFSPYFSLMEMIGGYSYPGTIQVTHNDMNLEKEAYLPNLKVMTYSPLGGYGKLCTTWKWEKAKEDASKETEYLRGFHDAIFHKDNEQRLDRAKAVARKIVEDKGISCEPDQVLNAYVLAHSRVDHMIIGPLNEAQLNRSVESLKIAKILKDNDLLDYLYSGKDETRFLNNVLK